MNEITIEQCLQAGAGGVYISNSHYHAIDGISGSDLSLLSESNRHLDNKNLFKLGNSSSLTFGSLLHAMVLEPHDVDNRYVVMPKFDSRTNAGKSEKNQFAAINHGKTVIEQEGFHTAQRMAHNVRAICGDIIERGVKEMSYFADVNGLVLKIRPDIYVDGDGTDWDVKTITPKNNDLSNSALERHIKHFNYHRSAGFRSIVRKALGMPSGDCYLIFVSSSPGHLVRIVKIKPEWIKDAEAEVSDLLDARRFYLKTGYDLPVVEIDDRAAERLRNILEN